MVYTKLKLNRFGLISNTLMTDLFDKFKDIMRIILQFHLKWSIILFISYEAIIGEYLAISEPTKHYFFPKQELFLKRKIYIFFLIDC